MSATSKGYILLLSAVSCIGIVRYKKLSVPFKILAWSVFAILATDIVQEYLKIKYHNNAPALQVQAIEEYILYSLVYYYLFKNQTIKRVIVASIVIAIIFFLINAVYLQPFLHTFPTNIDTPAQIFNTIFSLLLFKEMLDYHIKIDIVKQSIFWFNAAMLFYATTIFFMLSLSNYFAQQTRDDIVIDIWWFIDYAFHILIGISLLTRSKEIEAINK